METEPLVSIGIAYYNAERFFEETLESVLAQTYKNWELILANDGSTDDSVKIATKYAERFPGKIYCIEHPGGVNRGTAATRNLCLSKAGGKYFALLDADDVWEKVKLFQQVPLLEANPSVAMIYGRCRIWHSWTGKPEDIHRDWITSKEGPDRVISPPELLVRFLKTEWDQPLTCDVVFTTESLREVGGWSEDFPRMYEENIVYSKIFLRYPVYWTNLCLSHYRQHPENMCHQAMARGEWKAGKPNPIRLQYLNWLRVYIKEEGFEAEEIHQMLKKAFFPYTHPNLYQVLNVFSKIQYRLKKALKP